MNNERHQQLFEIFHQAVVLTGRDRDRFLDDSCQGDVALRVFITRLLAADALGFGAFDDCDGDGPEESR